MADLPAQAEVESGHDAREAHPRPGDHLDPDRRIDPEPKPAFIDGGATSESGAPDCSPAAYVLVRSIATNRRSDDWSLHVRIDSRTKKAFGYVRRASGPSLCSPRGPPQVVQHCIWNGHSPSSRSSRGAHARSRLDRGLAQSRARLTLGRFAASSRTWHQSNCRAGRPARGETAAEVPHRPDHLRPVSRTRGHAPA